MSLTKLIAKLEVAEKAWEARAQIAMQKAKETLAKIRQPTASQPKGENDASEM